jgi:chemotaxis protein MotB
MRRPSDHEEPHSHERWAVSYADFMTLLFALFVVLFASAHNDRHSIQQVSTAVRDGFEQLEVFPADANRSASSSLRSQQLRQSVHNGDVNLPMLQRDLARAMGKEIERHEVTLRMTPEGFVISLRELGFFNSGQSELSSGAEGKLQRIGAVLMKYGLNMRVEGHTDSVPIHNAAFQSNWDLSLARASTVAMMLLHDMSFDPAKISMAGYGEYHPVATNDTAEGRQANRRVDIVVLSTDKPPQKLSLPSM